MTTLHELRRGMAPHLDPIRLLWALNRLGSQRMQELHAHNQLLLTQYKAIRAMSERGEIAVIWHGLGCRDGGSPYFGDVWIIKASLPHLREHIRQRRKLCEGRCDYTLMAPSVAALTHPTERDLNAEAFEDGRAHCIHA